MRLVKVLIHVTEGQKTKLDALRTKGYTVSGYIRNLLDREIATSTADEKGR